MKNTFGEELAEFAIILDCGHYEYAAPHPARSSGNFSRFVGLELPCKGGCAYRPEFTPNGTRYPYRTALRYPPRKVVAVKLAGTFEEDHARSARDAA